MYSNYWNDVTKFNQMYGLPCPSEVAVADNETLASFVSILTEEVAEAEEISLLRKPADAEARAVAMADWLGDIIVYCSTFARRQGLPMAEILGIIMQSNFSKLGADGQPIYDERGKVLKGPLYWKPEGKIGGLLASLNQPHSGGKEL